MKQRTWQRGVIGIESDTVEIIGARWRRGLIWKENGVLAYKDVKRYKEEIVFRKFTHWPNLEAARDDETLETVHNLFP